MANVILLNLSKISGVYLYKIIRSPMFLKLVLRWTLFVMTMVGANQVMAKPSLMDINCQAISLMDTECVFQFDQALTTDLKVHILDHPWRVELIFADVRLDPQLNELNELDLDQTNVKSITTYRDKRGMKSVVRLAKGVMIRYQLDQQFVSLILSKGNLAATSLNYTEHASISKTTKRYLGKPITLNFQDVSVRAALQVIAEHQQLNLVTSDEVTGNLTLRLANTPWDQALDLLLHLKGLDKRIEGNILLVAPTAQLALRTAQDLEAQKQVDQLTPLQTAFIQVNYAKATELADLLKSEDASFLSQRGAVTVDQRTNILLIKDTQLSINNIRQAIKKLDVPIRQVLIESRMVTLKDNVTQDFGIRWGARLQQADLVSSGSLTGIQRLQEQAQSDVEQHLNVNLPVSNPAGRIAFRFSRVIDDAILDLELSALERENKGEIIASPRIMTANQKKARIEQGSEIPFVQTLANGATTVTFKKAVLSLEVTPHITPDDRVILDLNITQDTRGDTVATGNGVATAIDTQRIETQVLVENGETIVLGGIFRQQLVYAVSKVPILSDVPYLGKIFRSENEFNEKTELLIFVTPKIIGDSS